MPVLAAGLLPIVVHGGPIISQLMGTFTTAQENGCIHISLFYYRVDCSYDNAHPAIGATAIPWVGPTANTVYYRPGSPETNLSHTPTIEDGRVAPTLEGHLAIDRAGTAALDDDSVSGTLVVGPASRSVVTRTSADAKRLRAIESWTGITHTLAATRVTAATPNKLGGVEYVIASRGFPERLCRKADGADCFPATAASMTTDGKWGVDTWSAPARVPIGRSLALGGNVGAQTTAVVAGYSCLDNTGGAECARGISVWGSSAEDPGLDNLLLRLNTDAHGRIVTAVGFWTQEYRVGMGPPALQAPAGQDDSWLGGYMDLQSVP